MREVAEGVTSMRSAVGTRIDALEAHSWPGNIRELRNTIMQAGVLATGLELRDHDFRLRNFSAPVSPPRERESSGGPAIGGSLETMERRMIHEALTATGGHQQKAATRLGISRRTLSRKLRGYESEQVQAAP